MLGAQRYLYMIAGVVLFAGGVSLIAWTLVGDGTPSTEWAAWIAALAGIFIGTWLVRRGRRMRLKRHIGAIESESPLLSGPFVLYLRSFTADELQARSVSPTQFRTQEERLATLVSWVGRPIAIGSPQDDLPFSGFERIYVGDDWRTVVEKLLRKAELVLLRVGNTPNVAWEAERALEMRGPETVVWLVDGPDAGQNLAQLLEARGVPVPEAMSATWESGRLGILFHDRDVGMTFETIRLRRLDWIAPLLGDRRVEKVLQPVLTPSRVSRPNAMWLLGIIIVVIGLWAAAILAVARSANPAEFARDFIASDLPHRAESVLRDVGLPVDFELLESTYVEQVTPDSTGGEVLLANLTWDSQLRLETVAVKLNAYRGWANIADIRETFQQNPHVEQLAVDHCSAFSGVTAHPDELDLRFFDEYEGGWTVHCNPGPDLLAFGADVTRTGVLVDDWLFSIDVIRVNQPNVLQADPVVESSTIARRVVEQLSDD